MIELKNVAFTYQEKIVFQNLSLKVERGQKVGIVGESGCGKSTLLRLMAGLYRPASGSVTVDGENDPEKISQKVSIVLQTPMLLPLTIRENITMGHAFSEEWIWQVCAASNLTKWIETLPNGIDTYLGDRADELSGGQAQRIAIARAMCKNAQVLLLDEPTSALDGENAAAVLEALDHFGEGKTVLHVTHRPEHLVGYDRILRMEGGKLLEANASCAWKTENS
ncbi:MAG: ATP-binding cassette domain-containing protein [Lachnospiraceae bacterium]|nr:ATP-binding cassette domain-containing protein [Lachnospiraceae bacterium]